MKALFTTDHEVIGFIDSDSEYKLATTQLAGQKVVVSLSGLFATVSVAGDEGEDACTYHVDFADFIEE